jgi:hypothetical protein
MDILIRIETLINMANALVIEYPRKARFKTMLRIFESIKSEFSQAVLDKSKIESLTYGLTRVFQEMLDFEKTPFGEELGNLLIELNKYIFGY